MKYNTKSITNILNEVFVGRYGGVDIPFEAREKRYLPSFISDHIAKQLVTRIMIEASKRKEEIPNEGDLYARILGEDIFTSQEEKKLSLKEEIESHEFDFKKWQEDKKREEMIKEKKAEEILKEEPPQKND